MSSDTFIRPFGSVCEMTYDPTQFRQGDVIIFFMGMTGAGKSNIIDHLCEQPGTRAGSGLKSCTKKVSAIRIKGHNRYGDRIVLIDTPGFDDTDSERSDLHTLQTIMQGMYHINSMAEGTLCGVVFLHRISDNRLDRTKTRILELFYGLHRKPAAKNVAFVTTMWDSLCSDHQDLECQLKDNIWKPMIDSGSPMMRFLNDSRSAWDFLDQFYLKLNNDCSAAAALQICEAFEAYFVQPEPKILFLLLGATGVGKSTFINRAAGKENLAVVDQSVNSTTSTVQAYEVLHPEKDKALTCLFVDTPGFNHSDGDDCQILNEIVHWLVSSRPDVRFGGIIYLCDISANRLQSGFLQLVILNIRQPQLLERLILVTTICDNNEEKVARAQRHEYELRTGVWKRLLDKKAQTLRFANTTESAWDVVDHLLNGRQPIHTQVIHDELERIHRTLASVDSNKEIDLSSIKGVFSSLMESTASFFRALLRRLLFKSAH